MPNGVDFQNGSAVGGELVGGHMSEVTSSHSNI